jgi:K+-sensing histidine kinase KdpD
LRQGYWTAHRMLRLKPWSFSALLVAFTVLALAAALRELFDCFGATLYFATFVPAVLLASLFAGAPAGACAAVLTIPIVWWAFLPPKFEFSPLTLVDYNNMATFLLGSMLLIWFAQPCREGVAALERLQSSEEF